MGPGAEPAAGKPALPGWGARSGTGLRARAELTAAHGVSDLDQGCGDAGTSDSRGDGAGPASGRGWLPRRTPRRAVSTWKDGTAVSDFRFSCACVDSPHSVLATRHPTCAWAACRSPQKAACSSLGPSPEETVPGRVAVRFAGARGAVVPGPQPCHLHPHHKGRHLPAAFPTPARAAFRGFAVVDLFLLVCLSGGSHLKG